MSAPAPAAPASAGAKDGKEKSGLGKVLSRMKTVLKGSSSSSKRKSVVPPAAAAAAVVTKTTEGATVETKAAAYENATVVPRKQIYEERAKKLARYGFEIKPSEWQSTEGDVVRVEKPVRVRIHRKCHKCETTFGTSDVCSSCTHKRCKKCSRYPPRRTEAEKEANRQRREALSEKREEWNPIVARFDDDETDIDLTKPVLTRPGKAGGQDLVYKKVRQRTRRICHKCESLITSPSRVCSNCNHQRCGDCPRSPSSKDKYPYGYPNDEPGEKQPAYYSCQECKTKFPADAPDGTDCQNSTCSHKKCSDCPRVRARKVDHAHKGNPETLAAIRDHLANLKLLP